jgi:FAD/FMN-containing dehydrogenase
MMKRYATQAARCRCYLTFGAQKINQLLESLLEADQPLINTGVLSQSPAQFSSLWALREGVTEAVSKEGKTYKYDLSVPLSRFKEVVDATREHLRSKGLLGEKAVKHVIGYGHVGDGEKRFLYCT